MCVYIYVYIYIYIYHINLRPIHFSPYGNLKVIFETNFQHLPFSSFTLKTMCPPGYHHNGFMATHALGHMMYGYTLLVPVNQRVLNTLSKERNISGHV